MTFPKDFVWGAASASYQIEGAAYEDGKGLSVWDTFCREPEKVWSGNTGDVACDHYHRYEEDVNLMVKIGLKAYRFSISWPRVIPEGIGAVNAKGLAFYDKLVDFLLEKGIKPWVTLFHWDYPQALYNQGGWLKRDSADWFAEYSRVIVDKLSDRVSHWMPLNEPQCIIHFGHHDGTFAPGLKLKFNEVLLAAHHSLLAHGKAVQILRQHAKTKPVVGGAPVGIIKMPVSESTEDIEAAKKRMFAIAKKDTWSNTWYADPMIFGRYPEDGVRLFGSDMPEIKEGDMETICQPLDFYGANIYNGQFVKAEKDGRYIEQPLKDGPALTTMDWEVTPESLYWGPRFLYERYNLPIVVTENGMANCDWVHADGKVHDPQRIDFLSLYLKAFHRAIEDGVKTKGYFLWSIMDNFEWALGYKQRFGIIFVDYQRGKRTLKDSAYWYKKVIECNGENIFIDES